MDPVIINTTFRSFYQELYRSENISSIESINYFLDGVAFPTISDSSKIDLDKDSSQAELIEAIVKLQNAKSPGSDGLSIEFYRWRRRFLIHLRTWLSQLPENQWSDFQSLQLTMSSNLFALEVEPLAIKVRSPNRILGVSIGTESYIVVCRRHFVIFIKARTIITSSMGIIRKWVNVLRMNILLRLTYCF